MFSSNSTRVTTSSSVSRPESNDSNLKKRVFLDTKSKSTYKDFKKSQSSVSLVSNKHNTLISNVFETKTNVLNVKIVNAVNDGSNLVIQLVLWIVDSGCLKHMTGNLKLLRNFVAKFTGTVRFGNDHFIAITGTICHVYDMEGLGHNPFSVGQFCDGDLEVAFHCNTCYIRNLEGEDLLTCSRVSNLYTISISEIAASSPICLISIATSTKSWLWHRRLTHLNFDTINHLTKHDLVNGLLKFKYDKTIYVQPTRYPKVSTNSVANTLNNKDTPSSSSIIIEENEASQVVSSSEEPIANELTTLISDDNADESVQEDTAELDKNTFINPFCTLVLEEAESSSTYQDPLNMHEF
ncbi:integrase, catalytic region, zinc finger, CCHC-type containing protein [Tanacetum coccineum]